MKRHTTTARSSRLQHARARIDFDARLVAFVEANCPEHFTEQNGLRAIKPEGLIAYLEAVVQGIQPGDRQAARDNIHNIKQLIQFKKENQIP